MGVKIGRARLGTAAIALVAVVAGFGRVSAGPIQQLVVVFGSKYYPGDISLPAPTLYVLAGATLTFVNAEDFPNTHSVTSDDCLLDGAITSDCAATGATRLFDSGDTKNLTASTVAGVESVKAGTYGFHCRIHQGSMRGTLVVV